MCVIHLCDIDSVSAKDRVIDVVQVQTARVSVWTRRGCPHRSVGGETLRHHCGDDDGSDGSR